MSQILFSHEKDISFRPDKKLRRIIGALMLSGVTVPAAFAAGPPVSYGSWSVNTGTITDTVCGTAGVACSGTTVDDGFRYETVNTADGTFMRLIVTDVGATGDSATLPFVNEVYTPFLTRATAAGAFTFASSGLIAQGVAASQVIRDATLESSAKIQRGFAKDITQFALPNTAQAYQDAWSLQLAQSQANTTAAGTVTDNFAAVIYNGVISGGQILPDSDVVRGKAIDVWQTLDSTDPGTGEVTQQKFDKRIRAGRTGWSWFGTQPYNVTNGGSATLGGTTVSWAATEHVDATWIGAYTQGGGGYVGVERVDTFSDVAGTVLTGSASQTQVGADVGVTAPVDWPVSATADMNWTLNAATNIAVDPSRQAAPTF
ncbi:MAG: hypothetical protein ACE5EH_02440 [Gammaproteobacteria bacterium]